MKGRIMTPFDYIWLFFLLSTLQPLIQQRVLAMRRAQALRALEKRNHSRAITLIHRREGFTILGIPFGGYIDIDDSEAVIRAIEMTGSQRPIDLVLHTPGGLVLAAEQIAAALADHPGPVTVHVPHYAMSGGTLIALAADRIVLSPSAVLGPVDPQLGEYAAPSILAAVSQKDANETDDKTFPLYVACEGRFVAIAGAAEADRAVEALQAHPLGDGAAIIGQVKDDPGGIVLLKTNFGGPGSSTCWSAIRCPGSAETARTSSRCAA
jgi:membrane-bound ClpP family serine protease